jgi:hypothetical protein
VESAEDLHMYHSIQEKAITMRWGYLENKWEEDILTSSQQLVNK